MISLHLQKIILSLFMLGSVARAEETSTLTLSAPAAQAEAAPEEATISAEEVTPKTAAEKTADPATPSIPMVKNYATRDLITSEKSLYKFSFFSLAGGRATDIGRGGTSIGAYNYLGASKKIDSNDQIGLRYVFYYDSAGYKFNPSKLRDEPVNHQTDIGDPYFTYSRYSISKFSDWNLSGSGRIYIPLSRFSQATKTVTQLRTEFFFDRPLFKFSNFNFSNKTDYFVQTQKAYLDNETPRRDDGTVVPSAIKGLKQWNTENYIEIDANLSRKFSFKPRLGFEDSWYYGSAEESVAPRHDTDLKSQVGFDYRAAKSLSFTVSMENRTALLNRKDAVAIGRPEDNRWIFVTYASY